MAGRSTVGKWLFNQTFKETGEKRFQTLYSGFEYRKRATLGFMIGGVGLGLGGFEAQHGRDRVRDANMVAMADGTMNDLPLANADGVGYTPSDAMLRAMSQPQQSSPMNSDISQLQQSADGSLVFALHNMRNGGYLG